MELTVYDIIKGSRLTTKSMRLRQKEGKITFLVHNLANKIMVKDAIQKIWNVKVDTVRMINIPGKRKIAGRRNEFFSSDIKKAIITLKKGYKIELADQFETMGLAPAEAPVSEGQV